MRGVCDLQRYRNTIAGSSPGKRIFIYFEKTRFASQKTKFLNFLSSSKKSVQMTLNGLETTKDCKSYFILFFFPVFIIL